MLILGSIQQLLVTCAILASSRHIEAGKFRALEPTVVRSESGNLELTMTMTPLDYADGAELAYEMFYRNISESFIVDLIVQNPIPDQTQFRVGSLTAGKPPVSITGVHLLYSSDGGLTWDYRPVSGGGGAPPNYDAKVTHVRFEMNGPLMPGFVSDQGVGFSVRVVTN